MLQKQGEVLHNACRRVNYSPARLAIDLGLSREYVYALFKKEYISSEIIAAACPILRANPAEFFDQKDPTGYTIVVFRGVIKTEELKGKPWNQVESVLLLPGKGR